MVKKKKENLTRNIKVDSKKNLIVTFVELISIRQIYFRIKGGGKRNLWKACPAHLHTKIPFWKNLGAFLNQTSLNASMKGLVITWPITLTWDLDFEGVGDGSGIFQILE